MIGPWHSSGCCLETFTIQDDPEISSGRRFRKLACQQQVCTTEFFDAMNDSEYGLANEDGKEISGLENCDEELKRAREMFAAGIISILDEKKLSEAAASELTGYPTADFSCIREADLERFTLDRLMGMLGALGGKPRVALHVSTERTREAGHKFVASRTCKAVDEGERQSEGTKEKPLADYDDRAAYVLIAEPGAGKTTAFETEAASRGAVFETVRDFLTFDKPEWHGKTLFLDGLDESRAGMRDGRPPLNQIRQKLDSLGGPRFRLSCRWGDWLAINDRERLERVSPDGEVTVIRLNPLTKENIKDILTKNHGVADTDGFTATARKRGVEPLLSNPQNLELIAKLVTAGRWPDSRRETFEQACRMLAQEENDEHLAANPPTTDPDSLLDVAGRLCAVQFLAGHAGYTFPGRAKPYSDYPSLVEVCSDPQGLAGSVLGTRLFKGDSEGRVAPVHRQIAEFLAARHISRLMDEGLPLGRVLALITGFDGELVSRFNNFVSWLAIHSKASRKPLSRLYPSGLIYAGDQVEFSPEEKREIVLNLRREWMRNPHCFRHIGRVEGIGRIVSPELEDTFREILSNKERGVEQQSYVNDVLQMLADGEPLVGLSDLLEEIVGDESRYHGVRCWALDVLASYNERGSCGTEVLVAIYRKIVEGSIADPDDELLGILLKTLYPRVLPMVDIKMCLREPGLKDRTGAYSKFWVDHVPRESAKEQLWELLDHIAENIEGNGTMFLGYFSPSTDK